MMDLGDPGAHDQSTRSFVYVPEQVIGCCQLTCFNVGFRVVGRIAPTR